MLNALLFGFLGACLALLIFTNIAFVMRAITFLFGTLAVLAVIITVYVIGKEAINNLTATFLCLIFLTMTFGFFKLLTEKFGSTEIAGKSLFLIYNLIAVIVTGLIFLMTKKDGDMFILSTFSLVIFTISFYTKLKTFFKKSV